MNWVYLNDHSKRMVNFLLVRCIKQWYIKLPLKNKVFLWLLYMESILTKDNLVKRNWYGNEKYFLNNYETDDTINIRPGQGPISCDVPWGVCLYELYESQKPIVFMRRFSRLKK
jgi:hypothetical protein